MFSLNDKEILENSREARYKAECAMADSLDMLSVLVPMPVKDKAEKVYCYCSLAGNATFVAFYTADGKAVLHSDELNRGEMMEFNMAVMSQLVYLKSQYEDCIELLPSELFLEIEPSTRDIRAFAGMDSITDPNEVSVRSLVWFKEHGGKLARTAELAMKMGRFKAMAEANRNPAAKAVELDREALNRSRKYVSGEGEDPAITAPLTGWDALRAAHNKVWPGDSAPMSFESDDSRAWVDVYTSMDCWHYLSCGLSSMGYKPEGDSLNAEYSLRLKKKSDQDKDDMQIFAVLDLMRAAISKALSDKAMMPEYAYVAGEKGGLMAVPEKKLENIDGPVGPVAFTRLVYITAEEVQALESGSIDAESLLNKINSDVSDYGRKSKV